jgi:hypothetical protein
MFSNNHSVNPHLMGIKKSIHLSAEVVMAKEKIQNLINSWEELLKRTQCSVHLWDETIHLECLWAKTLTFAWDATLCLQKMAVNNKYEMKQEMAQAAKKVENAAKLIAKAWNAFYWREKTVKKLDALYHTTVMWDLMKMMATIKWDVLFAGSQMQKKEEKLTLKS